MKTINFVLLTITMIFFCRYSYGQGLNNQHPVDSVDIYKSFELLGVNIFKFPIKSEEKAYLKIITDVYHAGTLASTDNNFRGLENIPQEYLASVMPIIDSTEQMLRFYFYDKTDSIVILKTTLGSYNITFDVKTKSHTFDYRAFDYTMPSVGEKREVIVRYSQDGMGTITHCPGGTPVKGIIGMYKDVIIISIQLVKIT